MIDNCNGSIHVDYNSNIVTKWSEHNMHATWVTLHVHNWSKWWAQFKKSVAERESDEARNGSCDVNKTIYNYLFCTIYNFIIHVIKYFWIINIRAMIKRIILDEASN